MEISRVKPTVQETKEFYNNIAGIYDLFARRYEKKFLELGLKELAPKSGENILEIGFGTGHALVELAKAVGMEGKALGIDISEKMHKRATRLLTKENVADRVTLISGDAQEGLCFPSGFMDAVFMCFTLELFDTPDLSKVLEEVLRVLKPSGRIVVVALSKEGPGEFGTKVLEWMHKVFPRLMNCRPIYAGQALSSAGFEVHHAAVYKSVGILIEIVAAKKT